MTEHHSFSPTEQAPHPRAAWLRVLALARPEDLAHLAQPLLDKHVFDWLRQPEHGLVMVRARIGNTGDRFNVGEAAITRCAVRHRDAGGQVVAGVGHVMGLDAERATRVAQVDALLQRADLHDTVQSTVIEPLRAGISATQRRERAQAEASRVRFFTLQPEAA